MPAAARRLLGYTESEEVGSMAGYLIMAGKAVLIFVIGVGLIPVLVWFERKGSAFMQDRVGPNRASVMGIRLGGILHMFADVIKLIIKEIIPPANAQRFYFMLAPFIGFTFILTALAVIPFADDLRIGAWTIPMQVSDLNAGLLYIMAITSLNVYGMVLAGWSSNNKFALLGGLRSTAQMISYELPLGLSIVGVFMVFGSAQLNTIVHGQGELLFGVLPRWGVFVQPLGWLIFMAAAFAETNRTPFDLPEGESEIVAGYHVEYSGVRFALFFMGEYVAVVLSAALISTLYFGGWQVPYLPTEELVAHAQTVLRVMLAAGVVLFAILAVFSLSYHRHLAGTWHDKRDAEGLVYAFLSIVLLLVVGFLLYRWWNADLAGWGGRAVAAVAQFAMFMIKLLFFAWFFIWARWTLPRFRYDQLMRLGWKSLIPLSFVNIGATGLILLLLGR
jgi:NADH-quinone oxidoreductase subunit H